jgi:hypothetical protein
MAKRRPSAAEGVPLTDDTLTPPQLTETTPPQRPEIVQPSVPDARQTDSEQPARKWRANPFPVETVNLEGYKVQLQESRPEGKPWEMQIKFGNGSREEMPSDAVLEFIKSHRLNVVNKAGEPKEVQLFKWNDDDRAWGMRIDFDAPATSRQKAEAVFKETAKLVAEERGVGRPR